MMSSKDPGDTQHKNLSQIISLNVHFNSVIQVLLKWSTVSSLLGIYLYL